MEACEAINLGIYAITNFASLVLGVVAALMIRARKPDPFYPTPEDVADLCWPDGDHTPSEYSRKNKGEPGGTGPH